ncbi:helix-turn-helix transcriptional regulator [Streptomyces sp. NPDC047000]|uniref:helix-turn-helix domain-containing protein n=1 Tax=Streptomyces sp. NPDC047000 TaxID=3155474 RepID=UPI0033E7BAB3
MTSHQTTPGERPAEARAHQSEDLAALLERLLAEVPDKTQKDLAVEAGVKYPTLNAWLNRTRGTSRIELEVLRALAKTFQAWGVDTSPREFFEATGRPVPGRTDEEREARLLKLYRQLPEDRQRDLVKDAEAMLRVSRVS